MKANVLGGPQEVGKEKAGGQEQSPRPSNYRVSEPNLEHQPTRRETKPPLWTWFIENPRGRQS